MRLRNKIASFAAVVVMAGAIGAAPANAASAPSFTIPSTASLAALCSSVKQPALKSACDQGVAIVQTCASQKGTSAQIKCISDAAKQFKISKVTLPSNLSSILAAFGGSAGGSLGGLNLSGLLKGLDISKLLGGLKL